MLTGAYLTSYAHNQQPTTLFCHGVVDDHTQINRYKDAIMKPYRSFNFSDAQTPTDWDLNNLIYKSCSYFGKKVNRQNMAMGFSQDIETLKDQIDTDKAYILYGVSRGGSTIINYLAAYNPKNIHALVLDAAPADPVSTIDSIQHSLGLKFAPERDMQETIFNAIFPAYPLHSTPPMQAIAKIKNKNIPILLIHSKEDTRVSIASAWQLYLSFQQAGFTHVHLLELDHGKHSFCLQGPDQKIYLRTLHSFYKQYGMSYNPAYADLDISILQPSIDKIDQKLTEYQRLQSESYRNQFYKNKIIAATLGTVVIGWLISKTILGPTIQS